MLAQEQFYLLKPLKQNSQDHDGLYTCSNKKELVNHNYKDTTALAKVEKPEQGDDHAAFP